jgi:hypothetical protein
MILIRLDLESMQYGARYLLKDIGDMYTVVSDDPACWSFMAPKESAQFLAEQASQLQQYASLLELAKAASLFPLFLKTQASSIKIEKYETALHSQRNNVWVRQAKKIVPSSRWILFREVHALRLGRTKSADAAHFFAPQLSIERHGYWRTLDPGKWGDR